MTLRIGLGDRVGHAHGQTRQSDGFSASQKDVRLAVFKGHVTVQAGKILINGDVDRKYGLGVARSGDFLLNGEAHRLGNGLGIGDPDAVPAVAQIYQSVSGLGGNSSARRVMDGYGIFDGAVGVVSGDGALPEIIRSVNVIDVEGIAPGAVVVLHPFVPVAHQLHAAETRFGLLASAESAEHHEHIAPR